MPKQEHIINQFHGGLNTQLNSSDIGQNQMCRATDVFVGYPGRIEMMGGLTEVDIFGTPPNVAVTPGLGLYTFRSDYGYDGVVSSTNYVCLADVNIMHIYNGTEWRNVDTLLNILSVGGDASSVRMKFIYHEGVLYFWDENLDNTNNKIMAYRLKTGLVSPADNILDITRGFVVTNVETTTTGGGTDHAFTLGDGQGKCSVFFSHPEHSVYPLNPFIAYNHDEELYVAIINEYSQGEADYIFNTDPLIDGEGDDDWSDDDISFIPPKGGAVVSVTGQQGGDYRSMYCAEFKDGLSSHRLIYMGDYRWGGQKSYDRLVIRNNDGGWAYDQMAIYGQNLDGVLFLQCLIDVTGSIPVLVEGGEAGDVEMTELSAGGVFASNDNYDGEVYYDDDGTNRWISETTKIKYRAPEIVNLTRMKHLHVHGNRFFAANIVTLDDIYADRIITSQPNQFIFNNRGIIEAAVDDGDEITALSSFADRILVFKNRSLVILNIGSGGAFLEEVLKFRGVHAAGQVCTTPHGVAFINESGCFFYDGKEVTTLSQNIEDDWRTFIDEDANKPIIGFDERNETLVVQKSSNDAVDYDVYLFDLKTKSVTHGDNKTGFSGDGDRTNFITHTDGTLIGYDGNTNEFYRWESTGAPSDNLMVTFGDLDFGATTANKRIYKIAVTYKSDGDPNVTVQYKLDNNDWVSTAVDLTDTDNVYATEELTITPQDCTSFSVRIKATESAICPGSFAVDKIALVYRQKGVR